MGVNVGANDLNNVLTKSSMVGQGPQMRNDARLRETENRTVDSDVDSESREDSVSFGQRPSADEKPAPRHLSGEMRGLSRREQGGVSWQDQPQTSELPTGLQAQTRNATARGDFNVPFWLKSRTTDGTAPESPLASKHRLLNGLRGMLNNEIKQYVKSNTTYTKSTLRSLYDVLDSGRGPGPSRLTLLGEPAGLNMRNLTLLENTMTVFDGEPKQVGRGLDRVA